MTKISAQKIALDLYMSHTQRPDQAIQKISITISLTSITKTEFTKPVLIVLEFSKFLAHSSSTKECKMIIVFCAVVDPHDFLPFYEYWSDFQKPPKRDFKNKKSRTFPQGAWLWSPLEGARCFRNTVTHHLS